MTNHTNHRTSVSALVGSTVLDAQGNAFGRIREVAVSPVADAVHVYGLVIRRLSDARGDLPALVAMAELMLTKDGHPQLRKDATLVPLPADADYLLLERDLLDQQIIDINGHKVVRVNDVDLVWEPSQVGSPDLLLRIAEVEVGLRGAVRRLLKGLPAATADRIAQRFRPSVIPGN